ncbi:MAG: ATP-binding protein [Deltaproteobacteria bacterium]|nr:ATP-binding protein [Deltaproteobacteria bacterium]
MDAETRRVVEAMNPWWREGRSLEGEIRARLPATYVPRRLRDRLGPLWGSANKAHLVVGPRQAGKTTFLWKHLVETGGRILFLNAEDPRIRAWCRSAAVFLEDLARGLGPVEAIFLDEAQHLDEPGLFVKGLVDLRPGCPIFVTGSSAFHLHARTRESLAGRATRATLLPFGALELLPPAGESPRLTWRAEARRVAERLARTGGYPEVWTAAEPEAILELLVQAFLSRDASDAFRIRRPDAMRRLLPLAAGQVGNLVNIAEWASILGVSRDTVAEYCEILEGAHLIRRVPVFAGGKRAELTASSKVYFLDNGFRNRVLGDLGPLETRSDRGALLESWVFTELTKARPEGEPVRYWRTRSGAEVDFVLDDPGGLTGLEVKAGAMSAPRLSRSARSFIEAYGPRTFWVLNDTLEAEETLHGTRIRWAPFEGWLEELGTSGNGR